MLRKLPLPLAVAFSLALGLAAPAQAATTLNPSGVPDRTSITLRYGNGATVATPNSHQSRPALSLSKLYLGYWVSRNGAQEDKARVENMIRYSEDGTASYLDRKYPQAIPSVIGQFGLTETRHNGYWGNTTTSTQDMARFLSTVRGDPAAAPLFRGMETAAPIAADGYRQDYGTARIPGVTGTKFGWSDDRASLHATASTGNGFVIAAQTSGPAAQLTADVLGAVRVTPSAPGAPAAPGSPAPAGSSRGLVAAANNLPREIPQHLRRAARDAAYGVARTEAQVTGQVCAALARAGSSQAC